MKKAELVLCKTNICHLVVKCSSLRLSSEFTRVVVSLHYLHLKNNDYQEAG